MQEPHSALPHDNHNYNLHRIQSIIQNRILNRVMDIRNPIHTLLGLRRPHPRIHLRQRRRTERVVIAQQQRQTRDHNRDQQTILERRKFLLDVLCGFRDAFVDCGDLLV
jgi:hypothetical protein